MNQSSIDFLLNNNVTIIQVIFAVIFILVVFVIVRSFKEEKSESAPAPKVSSKSRLRDEEENVTKPQAAQSMPKEESPLDDLDNLDDLIGSDDREATQAQIDKVMATGGAEAPAMSTPPQASAATAPSAATSAPINTAPNPDLAQALSEKEKIIADLRAEVSLLQEKSKASGGGGDTKGLEDKLKELTEKLAEYEIIEDDIANLSFYKSENVKLKNELDKLKGNSSVTSESVAAEMVLNPATVSQAPKAEPVPEPVPQIKEPAPPSISAEPPIDPAAVLNEFEEAIKQKEAMEKNMPAAPVAPASIAVSSEADLLKEFESVVEKELAAESKPAAAKATQVVAKPAEDINSNKLVEEMEALAGAKPPEVQDDGKDSNQKLIEEFENFVNKT